MKLTFSRIVTSRRFAKMKKHAPIIDDDTENSSEEFDYQASLEMEENEDDRGTKWIEDDDSSFSERTEDNEEEQRLLMQQQELSDQRLAETVSRDLDIRIRKRRQAERQKRIQTLIHSFRSVVPPHKRPRIIEICRTSPAPEVESKKPKRVSFQEIEEKPKKKPQICPTITKPLRKIWKRAPRETAPATINVSTWYNQADYQVMKEDILQTLDELALCLKENREFPENDIQTARGLELYVTKQKIIERKFYKANSRQVVFDEQEDQRFSDMYDPDRIREQYAAATIRAKETALELASVDHKALQVPMCVRIEKPRVMIG